LKIKNFLWLKHFNSVLLIMYIKFDIEIFYLMCTFKYIEKKISSINSIERITHLSSVGM